MSMKDRVAVVTGAGTGMAARSRKDSHAQASKSS